MYKIYVFQKTWKKKHVPVQKIHVRFGYPIHRFGYPILWFGYHIHTYILPKTLSTITWFELKSPKNIGGPYSGPETHFLSA